MIGARIPNLSFEELAAVREALQRANIHVSLRGDALRFSPPLWCTIGDVDKAFDALAALLSEPSTLKATSAL